MPRRSPGFPRRIYAGAGAWQRMISVNDATVHIEAGHSCERGYRIPLSESHCRFRRRCYLSLSPSAPSSVLPFPFSASPWKLHWPRLRVPRPHGARNATSNAASSPSLLPAASTPDRETVAIAYWRSPDRLILFPVSPPRKSQRNRWVYGETEVILVIASFLPEISREISRARF